MESIQWRMNDTMSFWYAIRTYLSSAQLVRLNKLTFVHLFDKIASIMFLRGLRKLPHYSRFSGRHYIVLGDSQAFQSLDSSNDKIIFYFTAGWCPVRL